MYLSDRDLRWAIETGRLIIDPKPDKIDTTSIDLHLDHVSQAKIWDVAAVTKNNSKMGLQPNELLVGKFDYREYAADFLKDLSENKSEDVFRRGHQVIVKPRGFVLWQTKEEVGTADDRADLICFVDGKSTRARTGLLVHLTAPTIHPTWLGNVTLEIVNLGPFTFVLEEDDVIAQLTVATISSPPVEKMKVGVTYRQRNVAAQANPSKP